MTKGDANRRRHKRGRGRTTQDASCRRGANTTIHHALRLMYRTPELPVIRARAAPRYSPNLEGIGDCYVRSVTARSNVPSLHELLNYSRRRTGHILLSFYRTSAWPCAIAGKEIAATNLSVRASVSLSVTSWSPVDGARW